MSDNVPVNSPRNYSVQYIPLSQVDWKAGTLQYAFNGSNGEDLYFNATILFLVYSSLALELYLSVEIFILTLARFRVWKSLYFWSIIVTTCALLSDSVREYNGRCSISRRLAHCIKVLCFTVKHSGMAEISHYCNKE